MPGRTGVPVFDLGAENRQRRREIQAAFERVMRASAFIGGEEVERFEAEFAAYCGAHHCVGVGNGTDALSLALRALEVRPGERVLTVPFAFAAAVEAIDLVGASPVFADINGADFTLDVEAAAKVFEAGSVKVLIAVHLFGHPADMERLVPLARRYGAAVIEDAAQAHGARVRIAGHWRRVGALGDLGAFSFYPSKNLGALGDAGAVTTNDHTLAERVRMLHDHGQSSKYVHRIRGGTNSRLDGIHAAVLRAKLKYLDAGNAARRRAARQYAALLAESGIRLPAERGGAESVFHQYVVRVRGRDAVRQALKRDGIETAVHYPLGLHCQPAYAGLGLGRGRFPVAEQCAEEVLSLPFSPSIKEGDQRRVAAALRRALGAKV